MTRPSWDEYFMGIAEAVSRRGDCTRRQVGVCVVDQENRILATGFNGAPPGGPSCLAGECPRGRHYMREVELHTPPGRIRRYMVRCDCGQPWPCPKAVKPGSSYDTGFGVCHAVHAEANALLWARQSLVGCTLYVTAEPCDGCRKLISASGITRIVWPEHSEGTGPSLV